MVDIASTSSARRRRRPGRLQEQAVDDIVEAVRVRLLDRVANGEELTNLGSADEVAALLVDRLPAASDPWAELVGPCYSSGSLQRELGMTRAGVSKAVLDLRILRLVTADRRNVYPAFQVSGGVLVGGMREVLTALRSGVADPWTWAQWLAAEVPSRPAGQRRNVDRLIAGDVAGVVRDAERTAASWAS